MSMEVLIVYLHMSTEESANQVREDERPLVPFLEHPLANDLRQG